MAWWLLWMACTNAAAPLQTCSVDSDCVVAPAIAGHTDAPSWWESCDNECYAGVRSDSVEAWDAMRRELAPGVACSKDFEPCPPPSAFEATCRRGTCRAKYIGG